MPSFEELENKIKELEIRDNQRSALAGRMLLRFAEENQKLIKAQEDLTKALEIAKHDAADGIEAVNNWIDLKDSYEKLRDELDYYRSITGNRA